MSTTANLVPVIFFIIFSSKMASNQIEMNTEARQRAKLLKLFAEIVKDVHRKIQIIHYIRKSYENHVSFQMAEMIYSIRKKFNMMTFIVQRNFGSEDTHKTIKDMAKCQQLHLDTDKLIHMVEVFEYKRTKRSEKHNFFKLVLRTKEDKIQEEQKKREALRAQMAKIRKNEKPSVKKERQLEDGFDTD